MALQVRPYGNMNMEVYNERILEQILFELGDRFDIRIIWDNEAAILTGTLALVGGVIGGIVGGRLGATVGAGLGGAAGFSTSKVVSLREIWEKVKDQLIEILYIIYNYLRTLDANDYRRALELFMASSASNKKEFVYRLIDFIGTTLGRQAYAALL